MSYVPAARPFTPRGAKRPEAANSLHPWKGPPNRWKRLARPPTSRITSACSVGTGGSCSSSPAAGLGLGAAVTNEMPKVYESSTSVLVQSVEQDANQSGGRTKGAINLDTEAQLVGSGAVAVKAAELLRSPVSPVELARDVSVEVPANTTVLVVRFEADSPQGAQAGSHAFAEAYLRNRAETARAGLDQQITTLSLKVKQLTTALAGINARLAESQRGQLRARQPGEPAQQLAEPAQLADRTPERAHHHHGGGRQHHQRRPACRSSRPARTRCSTSPPARCSACCSGWRWPSPGSGWTGGCAARRTSATGPGSPCWPRWTTAPPRTSTTCSSRTGRAGGSSTGSATRSWPA